MAVFEDNLVPECLTFLNLAAERDGDGGGDCHNSATCTSFASNSSRITNASISALFLQAECTSWHSSNCGEAVERTFTVRVVGERN